MYVPPVQVCDLLVLIVGKSEKEAQKIVQKGLSASSYHVVYANYLQHENVRLPHCTVDAHTDQTDRTKRVKDAKAEAQKEIEEYRKKKEEEYKKFESEVRSALIS